MRPARERLVPIAPSHHRFPKKLPRAMPGPTDRRNAPVGKHTGSTTTNPGCSIKIRAGLHAVRLGRQFRAHERYAAAECGVPVQNFCNVFVFASSSSPRKPPEPIRAPDSDAPWLASKWLVSCRRPSAHVLAPANSMPIDTVIVDDERPRATNIFYLLKSCPDVNVIAGQK